MKDSYLYGVRKFELGHIVKKINAFNRVNVNIVEIGGGNGEQIEVMKRLLPNANLRSFDLFEKIDEFGEVLVEKYDGTALPLESKSVDIVFSSHVLLHVENMDLYFSEIRRILKGDGVVIFVVPTFSWRVWTNFALPVEILKKIKNKQGAALKRLNPLKAGLGNRWNLLTQVYYFANWNSFFGKHHWTVQNSFTIPLFYTGVRTFGLRVPIGLRLAISYLLGGSSRVIICIPMKKS